MSDSSQERTAAAIDSDDGDWSHLVAESPGSPAPDPSHPAVGRTGVAGFPPPPWAGSSGPGAGGERLDSRTAAAFTSEAMLRPKAQPPEQGWRRLVHRATGGLVQPAPSRAELERRELVAKVKTPVTGARRVAVISRKGGVGKTTTTLMLGHTFASYRGDRVVALDGNPDAGSLGYRIRRETTATVTDLLDDAHRITRYADIRAYTSQAPTRLEVVASDDDPHISQAIGEDEYHVAIQLLERHYNLILLDTGTGILDSANQGILRRADQLVVVLSPSLDGARAAGLTLDWLDQHGYEWLVRGAVAVLNQHRPSGLVDVDKLETHFRQRCRVAVSIPWDEHLEAGAETAYDELTDATRQAYLRLAAAVASGFADRPSHNSATR